MKRVINLHLYARERGREKKVERAKVDSRENTNRQIRTQLASLKITKQTDGDSRNNLLIQWESEKDKKMIKGEPSNRTQLLLFHLMLVMMKAKDVNINHS